MLQKAKGIKIDFEKLKGIFSCDIVWVQLKCRRD